MSTSDQQGNQPLTRKQLREIRLTGATPVITEDEAAAAAATAPATPPVSTSATTAEPIPAEAPPAPQADTDLDSDHTPLTRRQVREQERIRTASVPVITLEGASAEEEAPEEEAPEEEAPEEEAPEEEAPEEEAPEEEAPEEEAPEEEVSEDEIVSGIPEFARVAPTDDHVDSADDDLADDDLNDAVVNVEPVSAAAASEATGDVVVDVDEPEATADDDDDDVRADEEPVTTGERPVVNSMFGKGLLDEHADVPAFTPSFDELITSDSGGSQHLAPNTLIFTPSSREGSLSGPVASTGELLITGSYDLPQGIGSQGHAHGTADGKEIDAVLIDGELAPSSSPTPIAASSAISTTKPAGEVIRPPAPEKSNKLMLSLAIMAGGLALALAVVLIVAFTTGLF